MQMAHSKVQFLMTAVRILKAVSVEETLIIKVNQQDHNTLSSQSSDTSWNNQPKIVLKK